MSETLKFGNGQWATKEGSTLAYNDENGNFKPLPFNFTRATSATRVNKQGLIEVVSNNEPRIDFKDDANGALLLEPQSTNLIPYSDFTSGYSADDVTVSLNAATAPDGTETAAKLVWDNNVAAHTLFYTISANASTVYTRSVYIKTAGVSWVYVQQYDGINNYGVYFDITSGIKGTETGGCVGSIEAVGNGWYRCSVTYTTHSGASSERIQITLITGNGINPIVQGDGVTGVFIYGAQLEQGSYATSYIPTQGSTVTRTTEVCNNAGNEQVFNDSEGTLYIEANLIDGYDNNNFLATIFDNSNGVNNNIFIQRYLGNIQGKIVVGGTTQAEITESNTTSGNKKIAFTYKANEFKMFVNGSQVGLTDTSGSVFSPNTLDKINVGSYYNSTLNFNNGVKDVRVYDKALTDAELQALTS